jgi:protein O-GlcNAc transferase
LARSDELFASAIQLEDLARPDEALGRYRELLDAEPRHADAWHNQGLLLARLGRLTEAEDSHRRYAAALPDSARAHADLADVLLARERYADALAEAKRACELDPRPFLPRFTAGLAAAMTLRFAEAQEWLHSARHVDPAGFERFLMRHAATGALDRDLDPRAIYLIREFEKLEYCDWRNRDQYVETFHRLVEDGDREKRPICAPPLVFRSFHLPLPVGTRRRLADNVARRFAMGAAGLQASAPLRRSTGDRIRIGYVSPDFGTHPTGILSAPLFRLHDRSRFEVLAFSLSPPKDDPWRRAIKEAADGFHELAGLSLGDALVRVRAAQVDVLVDLAGITTGALPELFAARAAPVQVAYLGFPATSGAGQLDYLIGDRVCVPRAEEAGYSESLTLLPGTCLICDPQDSTELRGDRSSHGLPEGSVVFLAHHPSRKVYPEIFSAWMEILAAAPGSVLWLLEEHALARDNLSREAEKRGISRARLVFAPRAPRTEHQARIRLADLALDTPICNGGTTTVDALTAGIPVLTTSAPGFAGRLTASALHAAGLGDLVFPDLAAYKRAAIQLANDREQRIILAARAGQARSSALFDVRSRVKELEAAYERMLTIQS